MRVHRKCACTALWLIVSVSVLPFLVVALCILAIGQAHASTVPHAALRFQRDLTRTAESVWGLKAPVAALAAQIQQESGWNPSAHSAFAAGLTQFTPDTADWISKLFPKELGDNNPLSSRWALQAQSVYVKQLFGDSDGLTLCDRYWKALWKYNGGAGWVKRDERLAAKNGANPLSAKEVEPFNAGRAPAMFAENRDYPRKILLKWQPVYASWGGAIPCN